MKGKKLLAILMTAIVGVSVLAGCGGGVKTDSEAAAESSESSEEGGVAVGEGKDIYSDEIRIAFLPNVIGDSWAAAIAQGQRNYLDAFSNVTLDVYDGKASVDTQVQIMDELIGQKYDAIILQATDASGLAASAEKAEAAGIPVICANLDADTVHTALVAAVDVEAGRMMADAIGEELGGKGNVLIISATPGATKGVNIDIGFKAELEEKYPDIVILDEQSGEWLTENANTVMNDFLTKYQDIDAVMCHNDAMAEGAAEAVKAKGLTIDDIAIWGVDGESKMLDYIEQRLVTGTIYTNCLNQGAATAQFAMYAIASGIKGNTLAATPVIKMAPIVVTIDNVGDITEEMRW